MATAQHFLITTHYRRRYDSPEAANTALDGIIKLQDARGWRNKYKADGKYVSSPPGGGDAETFWIEDDEGAIVS